MLHVGDVVRRLRKDSGRTLEQVAKAAGISKTTLSQLEREGANFERETLRKIADVLETTEARIWAAAAVHDAERGTGERSKVVPQPAEKTDAQPARARSTDPDAEGPGVPDQSERSRAIVGWFAELKVMFPDDAKAADELYRRLRSEKEAFISRMEASVDRKVPGKKG